MLDIEAELKSLKLYGMAAAYAEVARVNRVLACKLQSGYYGSCCRPKQKIAISVLFVINCNLPAFRCIVIWLALILKLPRSIAR